MLDQLLNALSSDPISIMVLSITAIASVLATSQTLGAIWDRSSRKRVKSVLDVVDSEPVSLGLHEPPAPEQLLDEEMMRLKQFRTAIKAELESSQRKSFWPGVWIAVAINCVTNAVFFVLGIVISQHH
jgi:hypothetical protein